MLDIAGIGIGSFNLSLSALLERSSQTRALFFEKKDAFFCSSKVEACQRIQARSWLDDLVSPVDIANTNSFMHYLEDRGVFYDFIGAKTETVSRQQFADYLDWLVERIDTLVFGAEVNCVTYLDNRFILHTEAGLYEAKNICIDMSESSLVCPDISYDMSVQPFLDTRRMISSTGMQDVFSGLPRCLAGLDVVCKLEVNPFLDNVYCLKWLLGGDEKNGSIYWALPIFENNSVVDPQTRLTAWHSAFIINHIVGKPLFKKNSASDLVEWLDKHSFDNIFPSRT